jgi:hypothetical protein
VDLSTTTVGSPAAVAYQEAAASVVIRKWEPSVSIYQDVRHAARPGNDPRTFDFFGSLRFGQTPDHRSMNDSSGISSMPPESDGFKRTPLGVQATLSHVSLLGLSAQRHRATENFGSPVRKAANRASSDAQSIFGRSPESSDSTGTFGFHPEPSGSRAPLGSSPAAFTNKNPSGFTAHRRRSSEDFGPPRVRYNRHRASSDAHRNFRIPPESPRDSEASLQSHCLAVIELFH